MNFGIILQWLKLSNEPPATDQLKPKLTKAEKAKQKKLDKIEAP